MGPATEGVERRDAGGAAEAPERLRGRITAYMFIRLALATLLFLLAAWNVFSQPERGTFLRQVFLLAGGAFLFMAVSAALVRRLGARRWFVLSQLLFDALLITLLVQLTGGRHSIAFVFYIVNIAGAAYLVPQRLTGMLVAGANALAFASAAVLSSVFLTPDTVIPSPTASLYLDVLLRVLGFVVIGFLTNQLAVRTQQADAALARQQETTRVLEEEHGLIVQSVLSGILAVNRQGVIISANPAALARLGTCEGRPLSAVLPGLRLYMDGQELTVWGPEHPLTLLCYRSPLGDSGGEVVVFEDVTDLRRSEAERKKEEGLAGVGRIAAGIAHEIRNPLASLSGVIQMLGEERPGPLTDIAQREVLRLNDLVGEFLATARPIELRRRPVRVHDVIDETVASFGQDPRYAGHIQIVVDAEGDDEAELDPDRIRQVLWNLLLNAAQAMPDGGCIQVEIRSNEERIAVAVHDQGSGISQQDQAKIFDPFYTTRQGGTGLGLANVERLVRAHGGETRVRSTLGEGTTFSLDLPRRIPPTDPASPFRPAEV